MRAGSFIIVERQQKGSRFLVDNLCLGVTCAVDQFILITLVSRSWCTEKIIGNLCDKLRKRVV